LIHNLKKNQSESDDDIINEIEESENYNSLNFTMNDDDEKKNEFKSIDFDSMDSNGEPKKNIDIFR